MKKLITMQDISCLGKCSLTVALPTLSALGIETIVLPTAVLSTHTMFQHFTFHDLTDQLDPILDHFQQESFQFEGIYTGYLGSLQQIQIAQRLFHQFGQNKPILVDPCMADQGKLYTGFDLNFVEQMKTLCHEATIICPNLTEACLLTDTPYQSQFSQAEISEILDKLYALNHNIVILTGYQLQDNLLGATCYDGQQTISVQLPKVNQMFHGTGDLWASSFFGAYLQGATLQNALFIACNFVLNSIDQTICEENHNTYGVNFELALKTLILSQEYTVEPKKVIQEDHCTHYLYERYTA